MGREKSLSPNLSLASTYPTRLLRFVIVFTPCTVSLSLHRSRARFCMTTLDAQSLGVFVNVTGVVVLFLIVLYHYIVSEPKEEKEE